MTTKHKKPARRPWKAEDVAQRADPAQPGERSTSKSVKVPTMLEVISRLEQRWAAKPAQLFSIGQVVAAPTTVCDSKQARIVGVEWGPGYPRAKTDCRGWLYWLIEPGRGGAPWAAGESELLKWTKG